MTRKPKTPLAVRKREPIYVSREDAEAIVRVVHRVGLQIDAKNNAAAPDEKR